MSRYKDYARCMTDAYYHRYTLFYWPQWFVNGEGDESWLEEMAELFPLMAEVLDE